MEFNYRYLLSVINLCWQMGLCFIISGGVFAIHPTRFCLMESLCTKFIFFAEGDLQVNVRLNHGSFVWYLMLPMNNAFPHSEKKTATIWAVPPTDWFIICVYTCVKHIRFQVPLPLRWPVNITEFLVCDRFTICVVVLYWQQSYKRHFQQPKICEFGIAALDSPHLLSFTSSLKQMFTWINQYIHIPQKLPWMIFKKYGMIIVYHILIKTLVANTPK